MRNTLPLTEISPDAKAAIGNFHPSIVEDVKAQVKANEWVIVGMRQNPVVTTARRHLDAKGIKYAYIEHGSYFSKWKERLAIKLWTGWPTFPQVFHKGILIGGAKDLKKYLP
jgi:monothiol glutaredoxin